MRMIQLKKKGNGSRAGFMLAETMMAFGIAGVAIVSLYAGISQSFASIGLARENLRATQILVERMEALRLVTWDQLNTPGFVPTSFRESLNDRGISIVAPSSATKTQRLAADTGVATTESVGLVYVGRVEIDQKRVPAAYLDHMRRVSLTLTWRSGDRVRERSMETFVSEYGVQNYIY